MTKEQTDIDECPNCSSEVIIYKGWITFDEDRRLIPNADWRCPDCGEEGQLDVWERR